MNAKTGHQALLGRTHGESLIVLKFLVARLVSNVGICKPCLCLLRLLRLLRLLGLFCQGRVSCWATAEN